MSCREGHPPRHPDFEPGNTLAVRHGARSARITEPIAAALVEEAIGEAPYLDQPRFRGELWAWARAEARVQVLVAFEERIGGPLDGEGNPRPHVGELERAERRAQNARDRLGLNPASAARLSAYLGQAEQRVSLAGLFAELERRQNGGVEGLDGPQERPDGSAGASGGVAS